MGETQARRFLAKLNIKPPDSHAFYREQNNLDKIIEKLVQEDFKIIRESLPSGAIFGLDCSWSGRRGAEHAIVVFMETKSKLIFDKVIVSKNKEISDIDFHKASNLMESEAVKSKVEELKGTHKFIGFVHDFDVDTAPILNRDETTGDLIEYLDPGHLKKTLENLFKHHNVDGALYKLEKEVIERFYKIVRNMELSPEEKVVMWKNVTNDIIMNGKNKGYLVNENKKKRRISPEVAVAALNCFLAETEWLVRKCSLADTQAIESFNGACKAKLCPKYLHFQKSFRIRNLIAILKWNHPNDWYQLIEDAIGLPELNAQCKRILDIDSKAREKRRNKSRQKQAKIMRNKKRKIKRLKNAVNPEGHLYAGDEIKTEKNTIHEKRRADPSRMAVVMRVPYIANDFSTNCFINAVIQILRHTNIKYSMMLCLQHDMINLMNCLNEGNSITSPSTINDIRAKWDPFNTLMQEDAGEFLVWLLNDIYDKRLKFSTISEDIEGLLSRKPEPVRNQFFYETYQFTLRRTFNCNVCRNTHVTYEQGFLFVIPATHFSFEDNFKEATHYNIEYYCSTLEESGIAAVNAEFSKFPNFLMFQFNRFIQKGGTFVKDEKNISIPKVYTFGNEVYILVGIVYHTGQSIESGHYIAKYLNYDNSIETYDDNRCYRSYAKTNLPEKNAYILFFQKESNRKCGQTVATDDQINIDNAREVLKKHLENVKEKKTPCGRVKDKNIINEKQHKEKRVNKEHIMTFFRDNSYYCNLYCFDKFHNITSFDEFDQTFKTNMMCFMDFEGFKNNEIIKFFEKFTKSGCIDNADNYFYSAFKDICQQSHFSSAAQKKINLFSYFAMTFIEDPCCLIADLLVKFPANLTLVRHLSELFDPNSLEYGLLFGSIYEDESHEEPFCYNADETAADCDGMALTVECF